MDYYLRKLGDSILREECVKVEDFSNFEDLLSSMRTIMAHCSGCGLAAPQVGDNRKVILAKINEQTRTFVNPKKLKTKGYTLSREKCLSIPFVIAPKIRKKSIEVAYQDKHGKYHTETFKGFHAIILQHEMDHLEGKLIIDYFKRKKNK